MAYRATRRKRKSRFTKAVMGFVRSITAPAEISPEVQRVLKTVDSCVEHCTKKIEQLVPKTGD